jgi:hypothetical protein
MAIIMDINTLTLNGQTKLFFTNNSGDLKVAISDTNGVVGYSTMTLSIGDENLPYDGTKYSTDDSSLTSAPRNRNYIIRSNQPFTGNPSELGMYLESPTQTTLLGDKVRITNITTNLGNPAVISPLVFDDSTQQLSNSTRWIVDGQNSFAINDSGVYSSYKGMQGYGNEYTLLYSPIGMCKNGTRLSVTYGTFFTFASTDYLWYKTKAIPVRTDWFISTGAPPAPGGGGVDPFDPGGGGGPGSGEPGTGF